MKALIVPNTNDLNKGDQALVWESARMVEDTGLFEAVDLLGDEQDAGTTAQSACRGYRFLSPYLLHPSRKRKEEAGVLSVYSKILWIKNGLYDFLSSLWMLFLARFPHTWRWLLSHRARNFLKEFSSYDLIAVKGGGFIHAYGEFYAPYLMWYFLFYLRLGIRCKKKVVFLPNSFGPFRGLTVASQVRSTLKKTDLVYTRESTSTRQVEDLMKYKIPQYPDLGFYLRTTPQDEEQADALLRQYGVQPDDKMVTLTLRPWRFPDMDRIAAAVRYKEYQSALVQLIRTLDEWGYTPVLVNQALGPGAHEDDSIAAEEVYQQVSLQCRVIWINEDLPSPVLKCLYSRAQFIVGTRFHSVIFSLSTGVPAIAIGYGGNKAIGIMHDFGLDRYVIPINAVTYSWLEEACRSLISDRDQLSQTVKEHYEGLLAKRGRMMLDIKELYSIH